MMGYARLTKCQTKIPLSHYTLFLRLEFSSDLKQAPGIAGPFWHFPALDSSLTQAHSGELVWVDPHGARWFFYPDRTKEARGGAEILKNHSGDWIAYNNAARGRIRIENIGNPEWFAEYKNFKLSALGGGKKGEVLYFEYSQSRLSAIKSSGGNVAEFKYNKNGMLSSLKISSDEKPFLFEYHDKPVAAALDAQFAALPNAFLLKSISYPDGGLETFSYEEKPKRARVQLKNDFSSVSSPQEVVHRMTQSAGGGESFIEWSASTGMVMADSGGDYSVGNDWSDASHPGFRKEALTPSFSLVKYANKDRPYPDYYYYSWDGLVEITGDGSTGGAINYPKIAAPGKNYGRNRKIEKLSGGSLASPGQSWSVLSVYHYDTEGRMIREIDENKSVINYTYNAAGRLVEKTKDGIPLYLWGNAKDGSPVRYLDARDGSGMLKIVATPDKSKYKVVSESADGAASSSVIDAANRTMNFSGLQIKISKKDKK